MGPSRGGAGRGKWAGPEHRLSLEGLWYGGRAGESQDPGVGVVMVRMALGCGRLVGVALHSNVG